MGWILLSQDRPHWRAIEWTLRFHKRRGISHLAGPLFMELFNLLFSLPIYVSNSAKYFRFHGSGDIMKGIKAVPLLAMQALRGRGCIAPTHS
jgi:hypothetical protein